MTTLTSDLLQRLNRLEAEQHQQNNLLIDLNDFPDEVKRLEQELLDIQAYHSSTKNEAVEAPREFDTQEVERLEAELARIDTSEYDAKTAAEAVAPKKITPEDELDLLFLDELQQLKAVLSPEISLKKNIKKAAPIPPPTANRAAPCSNSPVATAPLKTVETKTVEAKKATPNVAKPTPVITQAATAVATPPVTKTVNKPVAKTGYLVVLLFKSDTPSEWSSETNGWRTKGSGTVFPTQEHAQKVATALAKRFNNYPIKVIKALP